MVIIITEHVHLECRKLSSVKKSIPCTNNHVLSKLIFIGFSKTDITLKTFTHIVDSDDFHVKVQC